MTGLLSLEFLVGALHLGLALATTAHVLLTKTDVRSAIGWTGLAWFAPVFGTLFYLLFGINRIRHAAGRMRQVRDRHTAERRALTAQGAVVVSAPGTTVVLPTAWQSQATLTSAVSGEPLTAGNAITPLIDGDEAYPVMLDAIRAARESVAFMTYIFDRGTVSRAFVEALSDAVRRGVQVRVLIDGLGARYSRPSMVGDLRERGVPVAEFLPTRIPLPHPYSNLRNHRKILVVDGAIGFTGGLNVRDGCVLAQPSGVPTRDVHFQLDGPIVAQLQNTFGFDWRFVTGETLDGAIWYPQLKSCGDVVARGIADGPDETQEALLLTLLGALAQARSVVRIVTPYFLPDPPLLDALRVTALRGVRVEIFLPEQGNLRLVQWAQQAQLGRVLEGGCHVYLTPEPFDHSKLMVVDGVWSLFGSANWDPRSLRLNFEQVVECYSAPFADSIDAIIHAKRRGSRELVRGELLRRPLWVKLRDGVAWLAQPYL